MIHIDFCVYVDIVVFKVEVVFFEAWKFFFKNISYLKTRNKNWKEKSVLGPKRAKVISLIRVFISSFGKLL